MARKRFNFWLDDKRVEDWKINEMITKLKSSGQFTRAIREGLRLWTSLRAGQVDVLLELFPSVVEKIQQQTGANPSGGAGQLDEIKAMLEIALADKADSNRYHLQSALPTPPKVAPPVAHASQAVAASADSIADNFLSMFN